MHSARVHHDARALVAVLTSDGLGRQTTTVGQRLSSSLFGRRVVVQISVNLNGDKTVRTIRVSNREALQTKLVP